jgi:hypothetical protein
MSNITNYALMHVKTISKNSVISIQNEIENIKLWTKYQNIGVFQQSMVCGLI